MKSNGLRELLKKKTELLNAIPYVAGEMRA